MLPVIQVKPLVGKWAADAERDIHRDYLLDLPCNQLTGLEREAERDKWKNLGVALNLYKADYKGDYLRDLQEFIASNPPLMRCPCARGVTLQTADDHYPRCDAVSGLRHLEDERKSFKRKREELDDEQKLSEVEWGRLAICTRALQSQWCDPQVMHMSTAFLQRLSRLTREELDRRCVAVHYT